MGDRVKKGSHHTEETLRRMSEVKRGRNNPMYGKGHSDETRKALSDMMKGENSPRYGKHHTEETKKKISDRQRERYAADPTIKKRISNGLKGRKISEEHKRKVADGVRERYTTDPEYKRKISDRLKGRVLSDEWCRKIGEAGRGRRKSEETRRKISERLSGEKNPNWMGGISYEPYCPKFNKKFKERVRAFFGRVCVECGTPENGKKLSVHHVNFNKMTCCDGTKPLFVPLCGACHTKTNHNREYWEEHFTKIIEEQYGGECWVREE